MMALAVKYAIIISIVKLKKCIFISKSKFSAHLLFYEASYHKMMIILISVCLRNRNLSLLRFVVDII